MLVANIFLSNSKNYCAHLASTFLVFSLQCNLGFPVEPAFSANEVFEQTTQHEGRSFQAT